MEKTHFTNRIDLEFLGDPSAMALQTRSEPQRIVPVQWPAELKVLSTGVSTSQSTARAQWPAQARESHDPKSGALVLTVPGLTAVAVDGSLNQESFQAVLDVFQQHRVHPLDLGALVLGGRVLAQMQPPVTVFKAWLAKHGLVLVDSGERTPAEAAQRYVAAFLRNQQEDLNHLLAYRAASFTEQVTKWPVEDDDPVAVDVSVDRHPPVRPRPR